MWLGEIATGRHRHATSPRPGERLTAGEGRPPPATSRPPPPGSAAPTDRTTSGSPTPPLTTRCTGCCAWTATGPESVPGDDLAAAVSRGDRAARRPLDVLGAEGRPVTVGVRRRAGRSSGPTPTTSTTTPPPPGAQPDRAADACSGPAPSARRRWSSAAPTSGSSAPPSRPATVGYALHNLVAPEAAGSRRTGSRSATPPSWSRSATKTAGSWTATCGSTRSTRPRCGPACRSPSCATTDRARPPFDGVVPGPRQSG